DRGLALEAADLLDQRPADVLRDVVRVGRRSRHAPGHAVNPVVMAFEQGFEGIAIALLGPLHELAVGVDGDRRTVDGRARNGLKPYGAAGRAAFERRRVGCPHGPSAILRHGTMPACTMRRASERNPWRRMQIFFGPRTWWPD